MGGSQLSTTDSSGKFSFSYFAPLIVLLAAFVVSMVDSQSYSFLYTFTLLILQHFMTFGPGQLPPPYLYVTLPFAGALVAVGVFYLLGKTMDFARHWRLLLGLSFTGALVASLLGYLAASSAGGAYSGGGFGFVQSAGFPEPSAILGLLAGAVGSFMFPLAGLAIAHLSRRRAGTDSSSVVVARISSRPFVVVGFIIAAVTLPLSRALDIFLTHPKAGVSVIGGGWSNLVSAYVGFLVYPVLFIATYFLLGRKFGATEIDLRRFGRAIFAAGTCGLLVGLLLNLYQTYASGWRAFTPSDVGEVVLAAVLDGVLFALVGIASATLGVVKGPFAQMGATGPWMKKGYTPVALTILVVALVATSTVAVSYAVLTPSYSCNYQPGTALYLRIVSNPGQSPIAGLGVSGELLSDCPRSYSCSGGCDFFAVPHVITTLGEWRFVTNSTGYVAVPGSMLGGSEFRFSLAYMGHSYATQYEICGGGTTLARLILPSGAMSAKEYPVGNKSGVSVSELQNGTQIIRGCNPTQISGNATIS